MQPSNQGFSSFFDHELAGSPVGNVFLYKDLNVDMKTNLECYFYNSKTGSAKDILSFLI